MQKAYVKGDKRIVMNISILETRNGNNYVDCWYEYSDRGSNNPSVRVNVAEVKYGEQVVTRENEAFRCSSGTISQDFLEDFAMLRNVFELLEFTIGHTDDENVEAKMWDYADIIIGDKGHYQIVERG